MSATCIKLKLILKFIFKLIWYLANAMPWLNNAYTSKFREETSLWIDSYLLKILPKSSPPFILSHQHIWLYWQSNQFNALNTFKTPVQYKIEESPKGNYSIIISCTSKLYMLFVIESAKLPWFQIGLSKLQWPHSLYI